MSLFKSVAAGGVRISKYKFTAVQVFGLEIVIVKFVHYQFRKFKYAKSYGYGFIQRDALACPAKECEIIVNDLSTAKSRPAYRLRQFIWITDHTNVNPMSNLFHGLAKSRVCLEFCQIRVKFISSHFFYVLYNSLSMV